MLNKKKIFPIVYTIIFIAICAGSFIQGKISVSNSEKEFSKVEQKEEAQATSYKMEEIDAQTGEVRWKLKAQDGKTQNHLKTVLIKDIEAELFKDKKVIFKLKAPYGKADSSKKQIYLFGGVTSEDVSGDFKLTSDRVDLGMGTSIEAKKGFNLVLRDKGTISGGSAIVNDDQTEIKIIDLKNATLNDLALSGSNVFIERNKKGDLKKATISNGGKVILKKHNDDTLTAGEIVWNEDGKVEARGNVTYTSKTSTLKADRLVMEPDGKIVASNHVNITHGDTVCSGNQLTYESKSTIVISGQPKAFQDGKQITAEKIVYNTTSGRVEAIGNVKIISRDSV